MTAAREEGLVKGLYSLGGREHQFQQLSRCIAVRWARPEKEGGRRLPTMVDLRAQEYMLRFSAGTRATGFVDQEKIDYC